MGQCIGEYESTALANLSARRLMEPMTKPIFLTLHAGGLVALLCAMAVGCAGDQDQSVSQASESPEKHGPSSSSSATVDGGSTDIDIADEILDPPPAECLLPEQRGTCDDLQTRYRFDEAMHRCVAFEYRGCGGNDNNFESLELCDAYCWGMLHCRCELDVCEPNRCQACPLGAEQQLDGADTACDVPGLFCAVGNQRCTCEADESGDVRWACRTRAR